MSVIFVRNNPKVKPTRRTSRGPRPFGAGILAAHPCDGPKPYTAADREWAAMMAEISLAEEHYDAIEEARAIEMAALEARWQDLHEAGLVF